MGSGAGDWKGIYWRKRTGLKQNSIYENLLMKPITFYINLKNKI